MKRVSGLPANQQSLHLSSLEIMTSEKKKRISGRAAGAYLDRSLIKEPLVLFFACMTISAGILFGGAPNVPSWRLGIILVSASALAASSVFAGSLKEVGGLGFFAKLFLLSIIILPLLQVIPLPPEIWKSFPGRDLELQLFQVANAGNDWHSISLNPIETLFVLVTVFPAAAVFLAGLKLNDTELRFLIVGTIFLAFFSIIIGLFQFSTQGGVFNFYNSSHRQFLVGFFANRNHQGLFLAISLTLTIDFIVGKASNGRLGLIISGLAAFFFIGAVVATASRSGLALTVFAVFLVLIVKLRESVGLGKLSAMIALASISCIAVFQSIGIIFNSVVDRYSAVDDDLRWQFWEQSRLIIANYFPMGTGLGTFIPIYKQFEPLDQIMPTFVNHVHNDYYELVLEAGLGGIIIPVLLLLALGQMIVSKILAQKSAMPSFHWAGLIIVILILVHSIVDYPLRTQAIAIFFGLFLAVIFRNRANHVDDR